MLLHRPPNSPAKAIGAATTPRRERSHNPKRADRTGGPAEPLRRARRGGGAWAAPCPDRAGTNARMPRDYIPDPTRRQVTTTGRETQVLNGPEAVGSPGAVTWPGLLGARPPGIRRPPSGGCWERPTIDLGKAPPTLAALQRQIAHRDCAWRSPTQPSTSACVTAQEPVLHQGHDPGTRYGPRRIHVLTVPGGRSSVWSQRSRAPGRLNRTGPEAQWSALGPQYTGSPGYSAGTNGHDRSAKPTARRTPHVDDLGRCRNPTAGSNPP
jgi:hypothetical protein